MKNALLNKTISPDIKTSRRRFFCPLCGKHTVLWLLPDTEVKNLPIKCKLCGKESVVNIVPLAEDSGEVN